MTTYNDEQDLIDRYIRGQLLKEEREIIKQRIEEDEEFALKVRQTRILVEGIRHHSREKLRAYLKNIDSIMDELPTHQEANGQQAKMLEMRHKRTVQYWAIAAAIMIAVFGTWLVFQYFPQQSNEKQLYAAYFSPMASQITEDGQLALRNATDESEKSTFETSLEEGIFAYNTQDWPEAISSFNTALEIEDKAAIRLHLALAQMESGKFDQAIANLEKAIPSLDELEPTGRWYLALSYIQQSQVDKAIPLLEQTKGEVGKYVSKASELLEELSQ